MATIDGTRYNDRLLGTTEADLINGLGGNDDIFGDLGDDLIYGGSGNDVIEGQSGIDTMYGQGGNDQIWMNDLGDRAYGGANDDAFFVFADPGALQGGDGTDSVLLEVAGISAASLAAATGIEQWFINNGVSFSFESFSRGTTIVVSGGTGGTSQIVTGTNYVDRIRANDPAILHGGKGNDEIGAADEGGGQYFGDQGLDIIYGQGGEDTFGFMAVGQGMDTIYNFSPEAQPRDKIGLHESGFDLSKGFYYFEGSDPLTFEPGERTRPAIQFDTDDGKLYYDAVAGGTGEKLIAQLVGVHHLDPTLDFIQLVNG